MIKTLRAARMGRFIPPLLVCIMFLSAIPVFGQDILRLTPEEAVDLAIKNNLSLESSRISAGTKKRKSDLAWNVFVPSVDLRGTLGRTNTAASGTAVIPLNETAPGSGIYGDLMMYPYDVPQWLVSGNLAVSLNINFALFEGMRNLRLDYESGLISYEKARVQLERDVRKSYYQILLLQENIKLMKENIATAERRAAMAEENYEAGLAPELSLLQARVALENLKPVIDELENGLRISLASFVMNLGLPYGTGLELIPLTGETTFVSLDTAEFISKAASGKPDIQELRQSILYLESARKASAFRMYTPTVSLGWNADPTLLDPWNTSWFKKDNWSQNSGMFSVTLLFTLSNLLPFMSGPQGLKDIDDNIRNLNIGLAQSIRGTEVEVYSIVLKLEKSRTLMDALGATAALAQRSYNLTEEAYRAGLADFLEVQNAELEFRKAQVAVIEENFNYLMGLLDLEYAIGVPFGTLSRSEG